MNKTRAVSSLSLIVCIVLLAAMALFTSGCNGNTESPTGGNTTAHTTVPSTTVSTTAGSVCGQGATVFALEVVDAAGKTTAFEIHTDQQTVGAALLEIGLIAGEQGAYGLYVKTVNGVTVDYDKDGKYWAFYVDGQYAPSGVDTTAIDPAAVYTLKVE